MNRTPPEFEFAAVEGLDSFVLPVLEPTVVHGSRDAPGLSRNFGSGTGVEREFDSEAYEADELKVGGSIVTGLAMTEVPITDCPIIGTL